MKSSSIIWIVVVIVVLLGGWFWFSMSQTAQAPTATSTTTTTVTTETPALAILTVHSAGTFGTLLVASNGMTLYTDSTDTSGVRTCSGACLVNWPAYAVSAGTVIKGPKGLSGVVSTIPLANGLVQVTYKGMPLYFWVKDTKAGDATGNGVGSFVFARP